MVGAAGEPHLEPGGLARAGVVHPRPVRDPHDRQVEAALGRVVVAIGHRAECTLARCEAGCWCWRASPSRRAAPTRPESAPTCAATSGTWRPRSTRSPPPGRGPGSRSSAAAWRRWTRPSATSAGVASRSGGRRRPPSRTRRVSRPADRRRRRRDLRSPRSDGPPAADRFRAAFLAALPISDAGSPGPARSSRSWSS